MKSLHHLHLLHLKQNTFITRYDTSLKRHLASLAPPSSLRNFKVCVCVCVWLFVLFLPLYTAKDIQIHIFLQYIVLLYDEPSQLALLKTSRNDCDSIRAAMTMITHIPPHKVPIVATTVAVNGSLRTAKRCAIHEVRLWFDSIIKLHKQDDAMVVSKDFKDRGKKENKFQAVLKHQMERIQSLE